MTPGLILFAVGAALFMLLIYGLARDLRRYGTTQIADRPPRAERIDYKAERRKRGPLPKQIPHGPEWPPQGHERVGYDEEAA
jgi:hypothetical protein